MKNNKFKKGRYVGYSAIALAAISLTTVGFSAWVIQHESIQNTDGITVNVADVTDNRLDLTLLGSNGLVTENSTINLDAQNGDNSGAIIASEDAEDLTFGITFKFPVSRKAAFKGIQIAAMSAENSTMHTLNTGTTGADGSKLTLPFNVAAYNSDKKTGLEYIDLVDSTWKAVGTHTVYWNPTQKKMVTQDPSIQNLVCKAEIAISENQYDVTYVITFTIDWGVRYNHQNPSVIDDGETNNLSVDNLVNDLEAIKSANKNFSLTIKHNPAAAVSFK